MRHFVSFSSGPGRHYFRRHHDSSRSKAQMADVSSGAEESRHCPLCRRHCPLSNPGCEKGRDSLADLSYYSGN